MIQCNLYTIKTETDRYLGNVKGCVFRKEKKMKGDHGQVLNPNVIFTMRTIDPKVDCKSKVCELNDLVIVMLTYGCRRKMKAGRCRRYSSSKQLAEQMLRDGLP